MAISNTKNVNILPPNWVEAEEISCEATSYTVPLVSSFTLMLEVPKEIKKHIAQKIIIPSRYIMYVIVLGTHNCTQSTQ